MIKYVVFPGKVISKNDGDEHYIGAKKLMQLYGVSQRECLVISPNDPRRRDYDFGDLIELFPQYDGDYTLPDNNRVADERHPPRRLS